VYKNEMHKNLKSVSCFWYDLFKVLAVAIISAAQWSLIAKQLYLYQTGLYYRMKETEHLHSSTIQICGEIEREKMTC
jgi:hypothetical protein